MIRTRTLEMRLPSSSREIPNGHIGNLEGFLGRKDDYSKGDSEGDASHSVSVVQ